MSVQEDKPETCPYCGRLIHLVTHSAGRGMLKSHTDPRYMIVCEGSWNLSVEYRKEMAREGIPF
jgi:hypothetical protein